MKKKYNFRRVYSVFEKYYKPIPLEVFGKKQYETLISTLMSSRTKDETTLVVARKLFKKAPNIKKLNELSETEVAKLIYPVGFYKTKARHIKQLTKILIEEHNTRVPRSRKDLMKLPGVGRKTANLVLNRAFEIPAIAVDTHVHRITNLLGWVSTKTPEKTEEELIKILPKKYWSRTNRLFVSIGKQYISKIKLKNFLEESDLI